MAGLEITLLLVGIVFMIGSFLITEKLSNAELDKVSELSEDEMQKILDRELQNAQKKIDAQIDKSIEGSIEKSADRVDRALEKETNAKIMAISEFSDTVMENMNKTHNEIMFLYSMLNDKHEAMTEYAEELQKMLSEMDAKKESVDAALSGCMEEFEVHLREREEAIMEDVELQAAQLKEMLTSLEPEESKSLEMPEEIPEVEVAEEEAAKADTPEALAEPEGINHNAAILELHRQGMTDMEIAKELRLGMGEVKLVLGLFREEEA